MRGRHRCPKTGCPDLVSNRLLACRRHWTQLTPQTQAAIHQTARLLILDPARRAALAAARDEWEARP